MLLEPFDICYLSITANGSSLEREAPAQDLPNVIKQIHKTKKKLDDPFLNRVQLSQG